MAKGLAQQCDDLKASKGNYISLGVFLSTHHKKKEEHHEKAKLHHWGVFGYDYNVHFI